MSVFIVYDSTYGNTEAIAQAMAAELAGTHSVRVASVTEAGTTLRGVTALIVGSPTHAFRPTPAILDFLNALDGTALSGLAAAAFDTRIAPVEIKPAVLRWVLDVAGYAADVIHRKLEARGCRMATQPAGFCVTGTEGPLVEGELERAKGWARNVALAAAQNL
nr:flavodoxin domain-containing protein [Pelagibacterium limicola]